MNNNVLPRGPIHWCCDLFKIRKLKRIDDAKDLGRIPARGGRIAQYQTYSLGWIDDENGSNCKSLTVGSTRLAAPFSNRLSAKRVAAAGGGFPYHALLIYICDVLIINHIVQ